MRPTRLVLLLVALLVLVSAAMVVPLPFFLERPGVVLGLNERVEIQAPDAGGIDGDFLLTTVYVAQGTIVELLSASVDDEVRVLPADHVLPPGESEREFFARQQDVFDETAQQAAAVGLRAAGFDVGPEDVGGEGALVVETFPDSAATGTLLPGDVIVEAAGEPVGTFDDLRQVLARIGAATLDLTVRRAGRPVDIRITPRPVPACPRSRCSASR